MSAIWLFLAMPRGCLQFVIVVFPDHTQILFFIRFARVYSNVGDYNNRNQ